MRSSHSLDRIGVAFDEAQLVSDAGLLLPATLAQHLGLKGRRLVLKRERSTDAVRRRRAGLDKR